MTPDEAQAIVDKVVHKYVAREAIVFEDFQQLDEAAMVLDLEVEVGHHQILIKQANPLSLMARSRMQRLIE